MPRTSTTCPRCRQPVVVDVEQLFDLNTDPQAKQRLLSGNYNLINCPNCGYEGNMSTPLVYHDPAKELLLTYFPPELGLPVNEQERLIGPQINQVVNHLPAEKRKGYLLRPSTMLTFQALIERILEADGVTKQMLEDQQKKLNLLQRLLSTPQAETRAEIVTAEQALIDSSFFSMLNRLIEATLAQGDQQGARQLALLQQELLTQTEFGRELQSQATEAEQAVKELQEASQKGLTRETLLDMMLASPSETRLTTLVSMTRSGLDYEFFNILSSRIEAAKDEDERARLTQFREQVLEMTRQLDQAMQAQMEETHKFLEQLLAQPDIEKATEENIEGVTELFIDHLQKEMQAAREKGDLDRIGKLQKVMTVLQKASTPPPEVALIEELMAAPDEDARQRLLEQNAGRITPELIDMLSSLIAQAQQQGGQEPEVIQQLQGVYRSALRFTMQANLKK